MKYRAGKWVVVANGQFGQAGKAVDQWIDRANQAPSGRYRKEGRKIRCSARGNQVFGLVPAFHPSGRSAQNNLKILSLGGHAYILMGWQLVVNCWAYPQTFHRLWESPNVDTTYCVYK